jgi:hypothetical protein
VSDLSTFFEHFGAITARDLRALVAMHAMVSSLQVDEVLNTEGAAEWAYEMSDALEAAKNAVPDEEEELEEEETEEEPSDEL